MRLLSFVVMTLSFAFAAESVAEERFENRLNELMLWRLSDELELKPQEDMSLKAILNKYKTQRKAALDAQESALKKIDDVHKTLPSSGKGQAAQPAHCPDCLRDYEAATKALTDANTKEFAELKKLLGAHRLETFLVIRRQMTLDVREALRQLPPATSAPVKAREQLLPSGQPSEK